jgi:dATP pyrophosphohydrolase
MRQPHNVLVIPFIRLAEEPVRYCALRRADAGWWQWVSGGVEDGESPAQAALREAEEELGASGSLFDLSMMARIPKIAFTIHAEWPSGLYLVDEHYFAIELASTEVILSNEHTEAAWGTYEESLARLNWQSNQTGLWELSERLRLGDLHPVSVAI